MIQHICDHIGCKNVVDGEELKYCLEMIGKVYCREHRKFNIRTGWEYPRARSKNKLDSPKRYDGEGNPPPIP